MNTRPYRISLAVILAAGLLVRIAFLLWFKDTVFFDPLLMEKHDQRTFHLWALEILRHPWHVDGKPFYMAPLYPYFLAVLYAISGGSVPLRIAGAGGHGHGDMLPRCVDDRTGCWTVSRSIAAVIASFYKTFVVYAGTILSDQFITFLYMAFLASLLAAVERPSRRRWVATGILLGLAALAKPTIALFLPFLLVCLLAHPRAEYLWLPLRGRVAPALAAFLCIASVSALTILPVTIRNYAVSGDIVPICTNGPVVNWRIGNSADSIGLFYYPTGDLLSPRTSAFWKKQAQKAFLFFTSYEWPQNTNVYLVELVAPVLRIAVFRFGFVVPIGMAGLILLCASRGRENLPFTLFTLSNVLWVILFFVTDRYRLPAVACFIVCASHTLVWTWRQLRRDRFAAPAVTWLCILLFAYTFNQTPGVAISDASWAIYGKLNIASVRKDIANNNPHRALQKALVFSRLRPDDPLPHFLLSMAYQHLGDRQRAAASMDRALRLDPERRFIKVAPPGEIPDAETPVVTF